MTSNDQMKIRAMGFAVGLFFLTALPATAIQVRTAEAPTTDLGLTLAAIKSAKQTLVINSYELTSPEITAAILDRIQNNVQVSILQEGQPVGGFSGASKKVEAQIVDAMAGHADDHYFLMTSKALDKKNRRFRYDHAKYVIVDNQHLLIGSENYSATGNPDSGVKGNRGWEIFLTDEALAQQFSDTFAGDTVTTYGDIQEQTGTHIASFAAQSTAIETAAKKPTPNTPAAGAIGFGAYPLTPATEVQSILSPSNSLTGLKAMLDSATTSLDIELMTFYQGWSPATDTSPLFTAVTDAAKRGVKVRVLLNDETIFDPSATHALPRTNKNLDTVNALNQLAQSGIAIEARIANIKAMGVDYIHNKGVLIDSDKTLISSINWDSNSVLNNREAAVLVTSPDVHDHYQSLFNSDWEKSASK